MFAIDEAKPLTNYQNQYFQTRELTIDENQIRSLEYLKFRSYKFNFNSSFLALEIHGV